MAPENDDDLGGRASGNLDEVRAWGERRDKAAREAANRAKDAEERAARFQAQAVQAQARALGLSEAQLEVLNTMNPNLEPEQVQAFAQAFNIQGAPASATEGEPAPPEPQPQQQQTTTAAPMAPVVASSTGVPPAPYTTAAFLEANARGDTAALERMASEIASGARPLVLNHPEAQEP